MDDTIKMASISFNPNRMEFLISFTSDDVLKDIVENKKEYETLNLGQAQILMDISHVKHCLATIKILLPTPLTQDAMNAVKKTAEKSEINITLDK